MTANVYTHTYSESERRAALELERATLDESREEKPVVVSPQLFLTGNKNKGSL